MLSDPSDPLTLPPEPLDRVLSPVVRFMHVEAASGIVLLLATAVALILANSPVAGAFLQFWHTPVVLQLGHWSLAGSLQYLINDGLMAVFFFVVGMEVKRELVVGELTTFRRAALPITAAIGGMLAPAAIYLSLHWGGPDASGWGIPMATDIAFVVGCMAILGHRVPHGLRVMLLTLAIADDIGAILVIAFGYSHGIHWGWLGGAVAVTLLVALLLKAGMRSLIAFAALGVLVWFMVLKSGVHATIAGVVMGMLAPARPRLDDTMLSRLMDHAKARTIGHEPLSDIHRAQRIQHFRELSREALSPLDYLVHALHPWVSFGIMPVFALANAGVPVHLGDARSTISVAVVLALVIGKPLGVIAASYAAVRLGLAQLPDSVSWMRLLGGGMLCGIGFTMALFIASLAMSDASLDMAKVGVLAGSAISAVLGMGLLLMLPKTPGVQ